MKMEIQHYRIFDKLSNTLNFRQTAKELNLSISIVSKKIKELENYYNAKLFHRTTRLVLLTEMGQNILPRIKELILLEDQIRLDLNDDYHFMGNLKVGIPFSYFESILSKIKLYTENFKSTWELLGEEYNINLKQKCSFSSLLTKMAINSLGIVYLPSFTVESYIKEGLLVEVLQTYTAQIFDIHLISKTPFSENRKAQKILSMIM